MKLTKKKVFVVALALSLVAIISMGTLAWFSASNEVVNNFYVADSDDNEPDEIFSVDVWENTPDGDKDQDGASYEDILPGDSLKKEARVENTGYYAQYVRVIITISDAQALTNAFGEDFDVATAFGGFDATKWNHISKVDGNASELVYVMYYNDIVESGDVVEVFDTIEIPTTLTQAQAATLGGSISINVKAQAVQTENVVPEGTAAADAAFAAFNTVGMTLAD